MSHLDAIAERHPLARIAAVGAAGVLLPLLGTIPAAAAVDPILVALSAVAGVGSGVLLARRRAFDRLPLELGRHAVADVLEGVRVVKVRARLGRGRVARDPVAEVRFVAPSGEETVLATLQPAQLVCGPFTLVALDPDGLTVGEGRLEVRLRVTAGGRTWEAEGVFADVGTGRFAPPAIAGRGRLALERDRWDAVEPVALPFADG